jgi:transketolase N-terminal domain/subunit
MMSSCQMLALERTAVKLRKRVLEMTTDAKSGHPSSCFSCAESWSPVKNTTDKMVAVEC